MVAKEIFFAFKLADRIFLPEIFWRIFMRTYMAEWGDFTFLFFQYDGCDHLKDRVNVLHGCQGKNYLINTGATSWAVFRT